MKGLKDDSITVINPACTGCDKNTHELFDFKTTTILRTDKTQYETTPNLYLEDIKPILNKYFESVINSTYDTKNPENHLIFEFCLKHTDLNMKKIKGYANLAEQIEQVAKTYGLKVEFTYISTKDESINSIHKGYVSEHSDSSHHTEIFEINNNNNSFTNDELENWNTQIITEFTDSMNDYYDSILHSKALEISKLTTKTFNHYVDKSIEQLNGFELRESTKKELNRVNDLFSRYSDETQQFLNSINLIDTKIKKLKSTLNPKNDLEEDKGERKLKTTEYRDLTKLKTFTKEKFLKKMHTHLIEEYISKTDNNLISLVNYEKKHILNIQESITRDFEHLTNKDQFLHDFLKGLLVQELKSTLKDNEFEFKYDIMDNFSKNYENSDEKHKGLHENKVVISNNRGEDHLKRYQINYFDNGITNLALLIKEY
ncbi:MAG: hypothetical protein K0B02_00160 [DPANN group archaeon]|nr:hypothetical protein [DPANN group archaeon]